MARPTIEPDHDPDLEFGDNAWHVLEMRDRFLIDPTSVPDDWSAFFTSRPDLTAADETATRVFRSSRPRADSQSATVDGPQPVPTVEPRTSGVEAPSDPGSSSGLSANAPNPMLRPDAEDVEPNRKTLRGAALRTAQNMAESLEVPTATSMRSVPMKLAIEQRASINNFLRRSRGGKVSFTHLIAWAMVQAMQDVPAMNHSFDLRGGRPVLVESPHVNLGIAIDVTRADGSRQLLVPNIHAVETLDFAQFWAAYEAIIARSRANELTVDDFAGTTCTITNPGGFGTNTSVPRLMKGQGVILGVGAIEYPAQFEGASGYTIAELGVSQVTTLTSTYDHRIIQGAQSGEFLRRIHELLLGGDGFYETIFQTLRIPHAPLTWSRDIAVSRHHDITKEARVATLVRSYRSFGHLVADTDPLEYRQRSHPYLTLDHQGLSLWDLDREFAVGRIGTQTNTYLRLREILDILQDSYCHTMGVEFTHIQDPTQRDWIRARVERPHQSPPREEQLRILDKLSEAEVFETFLQTKYVGQTRFSLEGAESAIVILSEICERAADAGLIEVAIGMPHRGRLNVLANITGKPYSQIFREFDNRAPEYDDISGDVKYHLGAEGHFESAAGNRVRTSVAANPSHLEAVNPVLEGIARAKQDRLAGDGAKQILPILMHGDASFAGQGIVYEVLQMSQLRGYRTGGTIHLIVNNQVGFTTAPGEARSSVYCTEVAKTVQAPILHVNGDDPDACVRAAELAFDFRQEFGKDVVIDMLCYRRRGHNEGDDPSFTQPQMYDLIEQKRQVRKIFTESLVGRGEISIEDAEQAVNRFRDRLEEVFTNVRNPEVPVEQDEYRIAPSYPVKLGAEQPPPVTREVLDAIASVYSNLPQGFNVHPKVAPQLTRRAESIQNGPIDWATGELLAFGSLLMEQHPVRLVGQDSRRGTFSQRFGAVVDRITNESWVPLKHLANDQASFDIYDSLLSEYGSLGFEYGYSVAAPEALVCWEAQYGDFVNGAQTILDEFVVSGYGKWSQRSGVVLLLPHGYEGAGPDHSSARLERFLQLCHGGNLAVTQPSTPASYFHLLRTHCHVNWHRPVVVATPKSMLRNKMAVSQPADFIDGTWQPTLPDPTISDPGKVERVLVTSGKLRWELTAERAAMGLDERVAIISLERFYPLPDESLAENLAPYDHVTDIRWVQEEPANQGAWEFLKFQLEPVMARLMQGQFELRPITRPRSSAPSVGSHVVHAHQQRNLLGRALKFEGENQ